MTETDPLKEYREKRDFGRTAEPAGGAVTAGVVEGVVPAGAAEYVSAPERPLYCIQKHAASRLHYDLRLEINGVLKSWAIPKGPSLDPKEKRLAVMTEDHPLEYGRFEGIIPQGEYGGGTVLLWDVGWWEQDLVWTKHPPEGGPAGALGKGELKFVLHGQKLSGSWVLVEMKGRGPNNWLLIKHDDESSQPGSNIELEAPDSAGSGRPIDEIAAADAARSGPT